MADQETPKDEPLVSMVTHTVTTESSEEPPQEEIKPAGNEKDTNSNEEVKEVAKDEGSTETIAPLTSMVAHTVSNEEDKKCDVEAAVEDKKDAILPLEEPSKPEEVTSPVEPKEDDVQVKTEEQIFLTEVETKPTEEQPATTENAPESNTGTKEADDKASEPQQTQVKEASQSVEQGPETNVSEPTDQLSSMVANTVSSEQEKPSDGEITTEEPKEPLPVTEEAVKMEAVASPSESGQVSMVAHTVSSEPEQAPETNAPEPTDHLTSMVAHTVSSTQEQAPETNASEPTDQLTSMVAHTVSSEQEKPIDGEIATEEIKEPLPVAEEAVKVEATSEPGQVSMVAHTVSKVDTTSTPPPSPNPEVGEDATKFVEASEAEKVQDVDEVLLSDGKTGEPSVTETSMVAHTVTSSAEQTEEKPKESWKEDAFNEMNKNSCLENVIPVTQEKKPEEEQKSSDVDPPPQEEATPSDEAASKEIEKEEQKPVEVASPIVEEAKPVEEVKPQDVEKEEPKSKNKEEG